jgi:hypothetical protein
MSDPPTPRPDDGDSDGDGEGDAAVTGGRAPDRPVHGSEEEIDEAGDESFPASDAPQWWSGEPETDA